MSRERVEMHVSRDRVEAILFLGDRGVVRVEGACALGDWASGTEGIVAGLEALVQVIRETSPFQIRQVTVVDLSKGAPL